MLFFQPWWTGSDGAWIAPESIFSMTPFGKSRYKKPVNSSRRMTSEFGRLVLLGIKFTGDL
jgi:hypothetical protein